VIKSPVIKSLQTGHKTGRGKEKERKGRGRGKEEREGKR